MTRRGSQSGRVSTILFWTISVLAWLFVNLLAALGVAIGLFILMANARWERFFMETDNLAQHYLAATPAVRADFTHCAAIAVLIIFVCLCASRYPALLAARAQARDQHSHGNDSDTPACTH